MFTRTLVILGSARALRRRVSHVTAIDVDAASIELARLEDELRPVGEAARPAVCS
jgi:hypothetical protein